MSVEGRVSCKAPEWELSSDFFKAMKLHSFGFFLCILVIKIKEYQNIFSGTIYENRGFATCSESETSWGFYKLCLHFLAFFDHIRP